MAATTFTSIVLVAFGALLLTMASWAWFGDWEPQHHRTPGPQDHIDAEVDALRREIEAYERDRTG